MVNFPIGPMSLLPEEYIELLHKIVLLHIDNRGIVKQNGHLISANTFTRLRERRESGIDRAWSGEVHADDGTNEIKAKAVLAASEALSHFDVLVTATVYSQVTECNPDYHPCHFD